jgi:hypothetical protein
VWVEGTILQERVKESVAPQLALPKGAREMEAGKTLRMDSSAGRVAAAQLQPVNAKARAFSIAQLPLSSLPRDQRRRRVEVNTVQAHIERKENGLLMTLYAEPLFASSALQDAQVHLAGEDSLVINIGSQRIVYKLPAEWGHEILEALKRTR